MPILQPDHEERDVSVSVQLPHMTDAIAVDEDIISTIHNCYIPNFRFINSADILFPYAKIQFNLDHCYYTPDYRGGLSAANFVILLSQSFLCFLYGVVKYNLSEKLADLEMDPASRFMGDNVKMVKMENVNYKQFVSSSDDLYADLHLKKIIDRRRSSDLVYFIVDCSACGGKYFGTFHLALQYS